MLLWLQRLFAFACVLGGALLLSGNVELSVRTLAGGILGGLVAAVLMNGIEAGYRKLRKREEGRRAREP